MRGAAGRLAALVLAAGFSSRMGSFKPLLPLGEATVIERAVGNFFAAGIQDVRVVVGHRAEEVIPVLKGMGVQIILNREYAGGMFSSVKVGVNTFKSGIKAFFLLPGDHPLIKPHTLWEIIGAYHENRAGIIYPCFNGERGHPPLISADYINKILAWNRQGGLRSLLNRYNADALDLEVADQGVLLDMDNPVDYQNMIEKSNLEEIPNEAECFVLLTKFNVPRQIVNHSVAVAQLAEKICMALNAAGCHGHECQPLPDLQRSKKALDFSVKKWTSHACADVTNTLPPQGFTELLPELAAIIRDQEFGLAMPHGGVFHQSSQVPGAGCFG
ncbi:MAG: NTP transferase domain-containing protein, partial [Firmicutes bacterium]|nr:NTP transferase domain-containing protein [Bacillota bacterium]